MHSATPIIPGMHYTDVPEHKLTTAGLYQYLRERKKILLYTSSISLIFFVLLKWLYPYPDLFSDSVNYVDWAVRKAPVAYRPTGYSYLLRYLHNISASAMFTVTAQYLLFYFSTMFLVLSAGFLYQLPDKLLAPLLILILANPMLLMQVNMISSDNVFSSLTVIWFTLCMWIVKRGGMKLILLQIVLLYLCFEIRYAALFYPAVAIAAMLFSASKNLHKAIGTGLTIAVIMVAIEREKNLVEKHTGTRVFSAFSGWQIANNALFAYKHIHLDRQDLPSDELQLVDAFVERYIDSIPMAPGQIGSVYIWDRRSPIKLYNGAVSLRYRLSYFKLWFAHSLVMDEYGWYIVKNFPGAFFRYYIVPNTFRSFYPEPEAMSTYCDSNPKMSVATLQWFEFDTDVLQCRYPGVQEKIVKGLPAASMLLNLFNIAVLICFFTKMRGRRTANPGAWKFFLAWAVFYLSFIAFNIFAAPVNLRFLDPLFVLGVAAPAVLLVSIKRNKKIKTA